MGSARSDPLRSFLLINPFEPNCAAWFQLVCVRLILRKPHSPPRMIAGGLGFFALEGRGRSL
jgi:hypothetical protein